MKLQSIAAAAALVIALCGCSERDLDGGRRPSSEPQPGRAEQSSSAGPTPEAEPEPAEDEQPEERRAERYAAMLGSGRYYIDGTAEIEMEGMTLSNPMLIAADGENSSISVSSDLTGTLVTMRTLTFDGGIYMINDAARSYTEIAPEQSANSFDTDFSGLSYVGEGSAEFCGEELEYEQYDQDGGAVRFFFEGDALVGLTRSIEDEQLGEMTLRINAISQNIPDRLIAMPIGYQKQ